MVPDCHIVTYQVSCIAHARMQLQ